MQPFPFKTTSYSAVTACTTLTVTGAVTPVEDDMAISRGYRLHQPAHKGIGVPGATMFQAQQAYWAIGHDGAVYHLPTYTMLRPPIFARKELDNDLPQITCGVFQPIMFVNPADPKDVLVEQPYSMVTKTWPNAIEWLTTHWAQLEA